MSISVHELLNLAKEDGMLSQQGFATLGANLERSDLTERMNNSLGVPAAKQNAKRVVLLALLIDDSGSIRAHGNEQAIRDAHNLILDAVQDSKQAGEVLVLTQFLNGKTVNTFVPIEDAVRLDSFTYSGYGVTPLYDETALILTTVLAKAMDFYNQMVEVQVIVYVVTDGHDEGSSRYVNPEEVRPAVRDILQSEDPAFILLGWGIEDGITDFKDIFTRMGFLSSWIMTTGNTMHDIRVGARLASRSAAKASQSAASFSKTAASGLGGFTSG